MMRVRGRPENLPEILFQLVLLLFTNPWGRVMLGLCMLTGGLIWGLQSHQVTYVQGGQGVYHTFLTQDNGYVLFQQDATDNYYVMHIPDYSPPVDTATILNDMRTTGNFSFIASSELVTIDATVVGTGASIGHAHPIEKVVFYDASHQNSLTYVSSEYVRNPNGYTINTWPYASPLMLAGALCIILSLLFLRRSQERKKRAALAELAEIEARPSPFARELAENQ
jgi:hypothetical protein